jgi:hypothetical protein
MPPENRRTFVKKSVATSVSISFVGLIRAAHGEGGGSGTTGIGTFSSTHSDSTSTTEIGTVNTTDPQTVATTAPASRMTCVSPLNNVKKLCDVEICQIGIYTYHLTVDFVTSFSYATQQDKIIVAEQGSRFSAKLVERNSQTNSEGELGSNHTTEEVSGFEVSPTGVISRFKSSEATEMVTKPNQTEIVRHEVKSVSRYETGFVFQVAFWIEGDIGFSTFNRQGTEQILWKTLLWVPHPPGQIPSPGVDG